MPTGTGDTKDYLVTETEEIKMVSDYSGYDFETCLDLGMDSFRLLFRDAFIYKLKQSEAGREYLEGAWLLTQTKPNKKLLREFLKE